MMWAALSVIAIPVCAILLATMSRLTSDELRAWCPRWTALLLEYALATLPVARRDRYNEEWASHIAEMPGELSRLAAAVGFVFAARKIVRLARHMTLRQIFLRPLRWEKESIREFARLVAHSPTSANEKPQFRPASARTSKLMQDIAKQRTTTWNIINLRFSALIDWFEAADNSRRYTRGLAELFMSVIDGGLDAGIIKIVEIDKSENLSGN